MTWTFHNTVGKKNAVVRKGMLLNRPTRRGQIENDTFQ